MGAFWIGICKHQCGFKLMRFRFVSLLIIAPVLFSCSEKSELGLCERVIVAVSRDNVINELWKKLEEPYKKIHDYDIAPGPEGAIEITANQEFLIDESLKFIDIDWASLGFIGDINYVFYYPLNMNEENVVDHDNSSQLSKNGLFQRVEAGNQNIRIRLYPLNDSFSADVECRRANSDAKKVTPILAENRPVRVNA